MLRTWRDAPALSRPGLVLVDCLFAVLVLASLGIAVVCTLQANVRGTDHLRSDLLANQLALDLLDWQAAGEARTVLGTRRIQGWRYRSRVEPEVWKRLVLPGEIELLLVLEPEVSLEIDLLSEPAPGERIRFARLTCRIGYKSSVTGRQTVAVSTLTDSL